MNRLNGFVLIGQITTAVIYSVGFTYYGYYEAVILEFVLVILFALGWIFNWGSIPSIILGSNTLLGGVAIYLDIHLGIVITGLIANLVAWDLHYLAASRRAFEKIENWPEIERRHLKRLSTVMIMGFFLTIISIVIKIHINMGAAIFLGLLAFVAFSQLIRSARWFSEHST